MNKKVNTVTILFLSMHAIICAITLETERTIWIPWTLEHSRMWEKFEQKDSSISQFRRNEYFEEMNTLLQRDTHWQTFCNLLYAYTGTTALSLGLGYAIVDKQTNELLGTIRFNISSTKGYLTLSYGLKESARNQKFGYEIAILAIKIINGTIGQPIAAFKKNITKNMFMAEWYEQGKLQQPDFAKLINLFENTTIKLKGLAACVDITNQPSLSILKRCGMKPIEIECTKYYLYEEPHLFCFSFLLLYPTITGSNQEYIDGLVDDILSRDDDRIKSTKTILKNSFGVPHDWIYLSLNRDDKAQLKLVQAKIITSTCLSDVKVKVKITQKYKPPYCFVQ